MPRWVFRDSSKQGADILYAANNLSGEPNGMSPKSEWNFNAWSLTVKIRERNQITPQIGPFIGKHYRRERGLNYSSEQKQFKK